MKTFYIPYPAVGKHVVAAFTWLWTADDACEPWSLVSQGAAVFCMDNSNTSHSVLICHRILRAYNVRIITEAQNKRQGKKQSDFKLQDNHFINVPGF